MFQRFFNLFKRNDHKREHNGQLSILIIEKDPLVLSFLERVLSKEGYRLLLTSDGKAGLQMARTQKPNLILLDYHLQNPTGTEVCQELKERDSTKDIPVVFLTTSTSSRSILEYFDLEAENYFPKPMKPRFLTSQVAQILEEYTQESPS